MESAGCVRTENGNYRPIVIVSLKGIYTSSESLTTAGNAIQYAVNHIESNGYEMWHFHKLIMDPH